MALSEVKSWTEYVGLSFQGFQWEQTASRTSTCHWISMKNKGEKGRCNLTLVFSSIRPNWFLKRHQMSTSRRNYWFFDTTQQEIFICVQLRPRTNRWGLTSAEWQIPTPPIPFIPKGLEGNAAQEILFLFLLKKTCLSSVLAHARYNYCSQINKGFPFIYDPC